MLHYHSGKTLDDPSKIQDLLNDMKKAKQIDLSNNSLSTTVCEKMGTCLDNCTHLDIHDCFTGRLKSEVPQSIQFLLQAAPLTFLDIGDNALSVDGARQLADYIQDSALVSLKLTNTGIGIEGIKHIANGLNKYADRHPTPPLQLFSCGRNRLEVGAKVLAPVLERLTQLHTLCLHQNGIRPEAISALFRAIRGTKEGLGCHLLKTLDLQDNSMMEEGSLAFVDCVPYLKQLEVLNLGECLTKDKGGVAIINAIVNCKTLQKVDMTYNELYTASLKAVFQHKAFFTDTEIALNGNVFDPESDTAMSLLDCILTDEWDDMEEPDSE